MVEIKEHTTIVKYQLSLLKHLNITDILMTTGYRHELLMTHLADEAGMNIEYIHNDCYDSTNYIKSLDNISPVDDDILLMHGDLIFEPDVLKALIASRGSCMIIDKSLPLPQKDFKAVLNGNRITAVGIEFFENAAAAQPLYKLAKEDWAAWKKAIKTFCLAGNTGVYAEHALNTILDNIHLYPFDIQGRLCSEIDNEEDLLSVREKLQSLQNN